MLVMDIKYGNNSYKRVMNGDFRIKELCNWKIITEYVSIKNRYSYKD